MHQLQVYYMFKVAQWEKLTNLKYGDKQLPSCAVKFGGNLQKI